MKRLCGCLLAVVLVGGCISFEPGPPPPPVEAVTVTQEGTASVFGLGEQTVFYPAPFLSPPSLEVTPADSRSHIMHLEQKADRFVVTTVGAAPGPGQPAATLKWKARGSVRKSLAPGAEAERTTFATTEPAPPPAK